MSSKLKYARVLLKVSGEALMGDQSYGIDVGTVDRIAADVKKYINYILSPEGQAIVNTHYYQKLPNPTSQVENVLGAAQLAAGKIN